MSAITSACMVAATVTSGLAAGAYVLYAHTIMPGLATTDDRTFVAAFQAIDRSIINPWWVGGTFFASLGLTIAAAVGTRGSPAWPWVLAAAAAALATTVITLTVHVPLNDAIKAAGDPGATTDAAAVRAAFGEVRWRAANLVRVGTSVGSFACLTWALIQYGRSS